MRIWLVLIGLAIVSGCDSSERVDPTSPHQLPLVAYRPFSPESTVQTPEYEHPSKHFKIQPPPGWAFTEVPGSGKEWVPLDAIFRETTTGRTLNVVELETVPPLTLDGLQNYQRGIVNDYPKELQVASQLYRTQQFYVLELRHVVATIMMIKFILIPKTGRPYQIAFALPKEGWQHSLRLVEGVLASFRFPKM